MATTTTIPRVTTDRADVEQRTDHQATSRVPSRVRSDVMSGTRPWVIETTGLTKRYGSITAVDNLQLRVRPGEVYGFLGPNGAGKTTTLRMLLGLIEPTSGEIAVLGTRGDPRRTVRSVGSMIETPAFYPFLSGHDNLQMLAKYTGADAARIAVVLDQVGLGSRGKDQFKTYSLGMKQRLGVAAALLKDPPLLILDEPTNGLDPAGMADMRDLIRDLGTGERTVLLSSHLMTEVEQVCDRVGVIAGGRLVAEGTVEDLRGREALVVRTNQLTEARRIVSELAGVTDVEVVNGALRIANDPRVELDPSYVNQRLVSAGIAVHELRRDRRSLESVFLSLTGNGNGHNDGTEAHHA